MERKSTLRRFLDTGFSDFLTLPLLLIEELGLPRRDSLPIRLADGSRKWIEVYEGRIWWNTGWHAIPVQASEGDPLIGMGLLYENLVSLEVIVGGNVTVEPLE